MVTISEIKNRVTVLKRWKVTEKPVNEFYWELAKVRDRLTTMMQEQSSVKHMKQYHALNNEIDKVEREFQQKLLSLLMTLKK